MKNFRKIWTEETNGWLIAHKELNKDYDKMLRLFLEAFPESRVSRDALKTQCSVIGVAQKRNDKFRHPCSRPLYSEHVKKGYVQIKIAEPSIWCSKAKWVYMETHPWEDFTEPSMYIFLDGNNRNFHPLNIERLPRKLCAIFNGMGGTSGGADVVRLRIAQAKLKMATLDAGEKLGLVCNHGGGRAFKERLAEQQRRYRQEERKREYHRRWAREHRQKLKAEGGEKWQQFQERNRKACREYMARKRGKK